MEVLQGTALMAATITMGIAAGVYLLYVFAIMPGLGRTDDPRSAGVRRSGRSATPWRGRSSGAGLDHRSCGTIEALGIVGMTVRVNVPLNDGIKAAGDPHEIDTAAVRERFDEARWVRWNDVRAVAATVAFGCLAWALVLFGRAG